MKKHWLLIPIASSSCLMPLVSCAEEKPIPKDKFEIMHDYYFNLVLKTIKTDDYKDKTVEQILSELEIETTSVGKESYYFKNIDYTDGDRAIWPAHQHIVRALQIAVLAQQRHNADLMNIAVKLTLYWLNHDYTNDNWWFNDIGVPRDISNLALMVMEQLTEEEQTQLLEWINHGTLSGCSGATEQTGTNLFWHAEISIKYSIFLKSDSEFDLVISEVTDEIKEDEDDGFQSDGSYFQHERLMYTGGYGRQGALMLSKIIAVTSIAGYEWPQDKLSILLNFVLNGVRYFVCKQSFNYSCMGRTYTRKTSFNIDAGTTDLGDIHEFKYLLDVPSLTTSQKADLKDLMNKLNNNLPTFSGMHYFPKSCFVTMNLDGLYMSFKGTKADLKNSEIANSENEIAYNMSYGTNTCVMDTGNEYNIMPALWDYSALPGTTSYYETDAQLYEKRSYIDSHRSGTFNGGQEQDVIFSMQQTSHGTTYTVTCFATNDGMVLVGSGLEDPDEHTLYTTVEQCLQTGPVEIKQGGATVIHNNAAYTNIYPNSYFDIKSRKVTGNWSRNNKTYEGDPDIQGDVLTIKIDNSELTNKDQYAYVIQPKTRLDKTFKLVYCDDNIHAILLPGGTKIAASFYKAGSFEYDGHTYSGDANKYYVFDKS